MLLAVQIVDAQIVTAVVDNELTAAPLDVELVRVLHESIEHLIQPLNESRVDVLDGVAPPTHLLDEPFDRRLELGLWIIALVAVSIPKARVP